MNCKKILLFFCNFLLNVGIPLMIFGYSITWWDSFTVCSQRICIANLIVSFVGPHKCISIIRFYFKLPAFEFETTSLLWLIEGLNSLENEECHQWTDLLFLRLMIFIFKFILIGNTICYALFFILMLLALLLNNQHQQQQQHDFIIEGDPWVNQQLQEGLRQDQINQLKQFPYNENMFKKQPNSNTYVQDAQCTICLDDFKEGQTLLKMPICLHIFHRDCIQQWLHQHSLCPNCRTPVLQQEEGEDGLSQESDINQIQQVD